MIVNATSSSELISCQWHKSQLSLMDKAIVKSSYALDFGVENMNVVIITTNIRNLDSSDESDS